jgi:nucleoid-associated protein YgaU
MDNPYTVVTGDCLWTIADRHLSELKPDVKPSNSEIARLVQKIVELNRIPDPDLIYPKQVLILP